MNFFNRKERIRLHGFILGSSLALFVVYALVLPDFRFFWDPSIKWFQILDLLKNSFASVSCEYPGRIFDPEFRHIPMAYVTPMEGECRYWFPYQLAYVFAPLHSLVGAWSVPILQHGFSIFVMYGMVFICGRLGLSGGRTLLALSLFRFGTANLNSVANLEDHLITAALFMAALLLLLREKPLPFIAGIVAAAAFAFRPEAILAGPFLGLAVFFLLRPNAAGGKREPWRGLFPALVLMAGFAAVVGGILFMNHVVVGHALGLRAIDPVNRDMSVSVLPRLVRALYHLMLAPEWWINGLLFQMPLLLCVPLNLREAFRGGKDGKTAMFLMIVAGVLVPLLYVAPFGGPHIGFRFATFLYPILIPLALRPLRLSTRFSRALLVTASMYTFLLTWPIAVYGVLVYRGYSKTHEELKAIPAHAVLLRDDVLWHVLSDHYYDRPFMTALDHQGTGKLLCRLSAGGVRDILLARSSAKPSAQELTPPEFAKYVIRTKKTSMLDWALLKVPAEVCPAGRR